MQATLCLPSTGYLGVGTAWATTSSENVPVALCGVDVCARVCAYVFNSVYFPVLGGHCGTRAWWLLNELAYSPPYTSHRTSLGLCCAAARGLG